MQTKMPSVRVEIGDNPSIERTLGYSSTLYFIMKPHGLAEFRIPWVQGRQAPEWGAV